MIDKIVKVVELFPNAQGCWHWRQLGGNAEILSSSEAYSRKPEARKTAKAVHAQLGGTEGGVEYVEKTAP